MELHTPHSVQAGIAGINNGPKAYWLYGNTPTKAFNALGALGSLAFAYNIVIIPEVQVRSGGAVHEVLLRFCLLWID